MQGINSDCGYMSNYSQCLLEKHLCKKYLHGIVLCAPTSVHCHNAECWAFFPDNATALKSRENISFSIKRIAWQSALSSAGIKSVSQVICQAYLQCFKAELEESIALALWSSQRQWIFLLYICKITLFFHPFPFINTTLMQKCLCLTWRCSSKNKALFSTGKAEPWPVLFDCK